MSLNRYDKARDENEPGIVKDLRKRGWSVYLIDEPCDLIVGIGGYWFLLEVKMPGARLTEKQVKTHRECRGTIHVVTTSEEAIYAVTLGRIDPRVPPQGPDPTGGE